jgi:hypothetical protein
MRAAALVPLCAVAMIGVLGARPARAFEGYEGTRALAMGGATRAWALGDSALLLNPSGMSLAKAYNVEAAYAYGSRLSEQFLHASVVDSTSESTLAGGIYYTYHLDKPAGLSGHAHEAGAALALPIGNAIAFGGTLKWFRFEGADNGFVATPGGLVPSTSTSTGLTFDVGATLRPSQSLSFAFVGVNLVDRHHIQAPRMITYGAAYLPASQLVVAVDGVTALTDDTLTGTSGTGVRGGLEASLAQRVILRAGGGTDPVAGAGYLAAGISVLSEVGAIDAGARGDLFPYRTGSERSFFVGVSLRLFVPGAVASTTGQQSP